ncbi:MAG TPA: PSD1 and planctomycete cytochrome C domain-containing protein [Planctomycetota bacterium]|nr:PSD1 and planctomycete cytochrome C domain-containing protein [Planctomycetota bacterium]
MKAILSAFLLAAALQAQEATPPKVDFVRDIQPIFKASCIKCHGAEKPKGQFRLDSKALALKGGIAGKAILPGKGAESPLVQVLLVSDPDERMPRKAEALPRAQIDLIRTWIDQGAVWPDAASVDAKVQHHWAYVKPERPRLPKVLNPDLARNAIDTFLLGRLDKEGLTYSPEASKETLIRRLSLDLTGLPPDLKEVDEFVADASAGAYEKLVDRLIASPHYGERWARPWLDLARYADTNGFNFDSRRTMWKYRDWVINALNRDLPFDQFSIEQIAGDLLPGSTIEQKIATGFHRNTMTNEEGGTDPDEARWETLIDRVTTTAAVWLGTTLNCCQCHNHKYDPFTQKEFYQFLAFFESSEEPKIELLSPEQQAHRKDLRARIAHEEEQLKKANLPEHVAKALKIAIEKRSNTQRNDVVVFCRSQAPADLKPLTAPLLDLYAELDTLDVGTALVLREKPNEMPSTYFRIKGGYTNRGEKVTAAVPASLPPVPAGKPLNRLGLAYWLVDENNPLTARVVVNRFWGEFFGRPLVESPEDFGTQSLPPTHPELLDWLATEFMARGWSMKAIHKTIVMSAAYRQSSHVNRAMAERDPYNRLLARGPRFRMEAEMIRDSMLAASGLLSRKVGGPSVFPLQADTSGVIAINKVDTAWVTSGGEDRYRRGLYTHWRRTAPFAAFAIFDAPSRECCIVRRQRTNTPLQALAALNDPAFFDAARGLALRVLKEGPGSVEGKIELAFRLCTSRKPRADEVALLAAELGRQTEHFRKHPEAANAVFKGSLAKPADGDAVAAAAWTMLSNVMINLDETLTKE